MLEGLKSTFKLSNQWCAQRFTRGWKKGMQTYPISNLRGVLTRPYTHQPHAPYLINRTISSFIKIHHHLYRKHLTTAYYGHTDEHTLTVEKLANMSKWWCFALRYVKLNTEKILSKFCLAFFVRSRGKLRHIMYERCFFPWKKWKVVHQKEDKSLEKLNFFKI